MSSSQSFVTQFFLEITEGEAKEETQSSVNYLFFIPSASDLQKEQGKVLCD